MVVSGLLAFLLSLVVLTSHDATITVYVAKSDIVAGKSISTSLFEPKLVKSTSLDSQFVSKDTLTSDKKYFAARSIRAGEPLTVGALTPDAQQTDVRLLSIPIDKNLAVAGAISRGDRIDIIATPDGECATRVLRNLEVVVTPSSSGGGALGGGSGSYTITVAIDKAGDDLTLAGVIASGKFQVVKTTGAADSDPVLTDPYCDGSGDNGSDSSNSDQVGG